MKTYILLSLLVLNLLSSCNGREPDQPYLYELNPQYTSGYAQFYGGNSAGSQNPNNVLSVSLFTDSLKFNIDGTPEGVGQQLFLRDIFISPTDTFLPEGTYLASKSGKPFTFLIGEKLIVDERSYTLGATIHYYEKNSSISTEKLIVDGSFSVSRQVEIYTIVCDFITNDSTELKGVFIGKLPYTDESLVNY